jgi:hypothetical protein
MNDDRRQLTTEEQREQFHLARRRGGQCAGCGRALSTDETVYVERFKIGPSFGWGVTATALVGAECASSEFIEAMEGREPERCAGCGRGVYYRASRVRRRQALCSRACRAKVQAGKQPKPEG